MHAGTAIHEDLAGRRHIGAPLARGALLHGLRRELRLAYLFGGRDAPALILPGTLLTAAGLLHLGHGAGAAPTLLRAIATLAFSVAYHSLCLLCFVILNQIVGVEEDRVNAPHRPLCAGLVSRRGAFTRLAVCAGLALLLAASRPAVLPWCALFLVATVVNNCTGIDRLPLAKDAMVFVGFALHLGAGWTAAVPTFAGSDAARWILALSLGFVLVIPMQDLRDVVGDRAAGRRTLPIVLGDRWIRRYLCAACLVLPFGLVLPYLIVPGLALRQQMPVPGALFARPALLGAWLASHVVLTAALLPAVLLAAHVALRVVRFRSPRDDNRTYLLMTAWVAYVTCLSLVLL